MKIKWNQEVTCFRTAEAGIRASNIVRYPALAPPYLLTAATEASKASAPAEKQQGLFSM